MSQESPNSQTSPSPKRKPRENSSQVAVKTQTIKLLRGTVGVLEKAIAQLEAESTTSAEASWWEPLQGGWGFVLEKIRSLLPASLSGKLSNSALTGVLAGLAIILVLTSLNLFSGKSTAVAVAPSPLPEAPAVTTTPSPEPEPPAVTTTPSSEPEPPAVAASPPIAKPSPVASPTGELEPNLSIPTELSAPATPQSVEEIALPESTPTLIAQLTPEEILVATIQKQVEEISDRVAAGLIQSIQPNFEGSNLVITLGDNWYDLKSSQQDELAAQMLERSRGLDFSRLEAIDPKGNLVARSPVVGQDMIIFRRQSLSGDG